MKDRQRGLGMSGGWRKVGDGEYVANVPVTFTESGFTKFAEQSRARWDLVAYLKSKLPKLSSTKASIEVKK